MISVSEATDIVSGQVVPLESERVGLIDSVGRTVAEPIIADTDMPPFDRSQMDGYAVRAQDTSEPPAHLRIVGEAAAGRGWHHRLNTGEAIAIMTGAPLPDGADAVQKIELTGSQIVGESCEGSHVKILESVETGRNIVSRGSEVRKGHALLQRGSVITDQMIAMLAAFGHAEVRVAKSPQVAILGTGSEIVSIDQTPGPDQIRNSNSIMLAVMAKRNGAAPRLLPNVADDLTALISQISGAARSADVLIITGGVSVGKYDLTKAALTELGTEIFFDRVRLRPGKPAVFGLLDKTLIFGLPGNPVSAAVTFHLFVRLALGLMQGQTEPRPKTGFAVLAADVKAARERDTYLPSRLSVDKAARIIVEPLGGQGSSDFVRFSQAEALIAIERGTSKRAGEIVPIEFL
jgi:molybdopterin molybdotransferase